MNERAPHTTRRSRNRPGGTFFECRADTGLSVADLRVRLAAVLDELEAGDAGVDLAIELLLQLLEDLDLVAAEIAT
jgi:hypothetical protein